MVLARRAIAAQTEVSGLMADCLTNSEVVKHCVAEEVVEKRIGAAFKRTETAWTQYYKTLTAYGIGTQTITSVFRLAVILYAVHAYRTAEISIGTFILVYSYIAQIVRPIQTIGFALQVVSQGFAHLVDSPDLLDEVAEDFSDREPRPHAVGPASIALESVHAGYRPERRVLEDININVPPGRTLAIVGPSGSGKSTIAKLLTRMIEPSGGRILLDGVPIRELGLDQLRRSIAVVSQDTVLFNDTIALNIAFGKKDCDRWEVERAARIAHLHDWVSRLEHGYDTVVGERGLQISGGERQRIAIARAAVANPRIYLWDEATSSLDSATEREILRNIREIAHRSTTIIIAHRLSTIVLADEIVVLQEGRIVERGSHATLVTAGGVYSHLWRAQRRGRVGVAVSL